MLSHVVVGEPDLRGRCPRCGGNRYRFPLQAISEAGVTGVGSVDACPDCDDVKSVVTQWRTRFE